MTYPLQRPKPDISSHGLWYTTTGGILINIGIGGIAGLNSHIFEMSQKDRLPDRYQLMDPMLQDDLVEQIRTEYLAELQQ